MKKNYNFSNRRRGFMSIFLIVALGFLSMNSWSQDQEIEWTGATDSDATNPLNWEPNATPLENYLRIDSAYKFTNLPELSLTGDNLIRAIYPRPTAVFTINDAGNYLDINQSGGNYEHDGTIILKAGNMSYRKNLYLDDSTAVFILEGGSLETRGYLLLSSGDDGPTGGRIEASGTSRLHFRIAPGRFSADTTRSVIKITDDAFIEIRGDWVESAKYFIGRNQITSDDTYDPYAYYDVDLAWTIIDLRPKDDLFLESTATIQALTGETVDVIKAANNRGFQNLVSKEWKYSTTSGGPYVSFDPAQIEDSLYNISFNDAGNYFIVLEGNDGSTTKMSDEIQVAVTSPMVTLTPDGEQTIRMGWTGGLITASYEQTPTSVEWKYSTTSGSGYASFDPVNTTDEFLPSFTDEGIYYVVCEAVVEGVTYLSPEVTIKMVPRSYAAQAITWTGAVSNDASDNRNYDPLMHPWFNDVTVPSRDWLDNPPTLSTTGNDTVRSIWCFDSAAFVINKPMTDTLTITGDPYRNGRLIIESGIVNNRGFGRLDHKNAAIVIKNQSQCLFTGSYGFIIGNSKNTAGGQVFIQDDGYMLVTSEGSGVWRWTSDTTMSIIHISDNGMLEVAGDWLSDMATRVATNQLRAPEGFVINYEYKIVDQDTSTVVTAKSEVAFDITPLDEQFVGVGLAMEELSTINDDVITSREWKYTTTSGEGYMAFDPAETGATLTASFDAAGTYYVICEGSDGTDTYVSDEAIVTVVSVDIAPADAQEIIVFEEGDLLTVTESVVPDSREWKFTSTPGSGYGSFSPARLSDTYRPFFTEIGTYYIICESVYGGKGIVSNEVEVSIINDTVGIEEFKLPVDVYPNPSEGEFYLNVESGDSYDVAVYDITGKLVKEYLNSTGRQPIFIEKEGLYLLKVSQGEATVTRKVIIR